MVARKEKPRLAKCDASNQRRHTGQRKRGLPGWIYGGCSKCRRPEANVNGARFGYLCQTRRGIGRVSGDQTDRVLADSKGRGQVAVAGADY